MKHIIVPQAICFLLAWPLMANGNTRPSPNDAAAAVESLMSAYNHSSGLWDAWSGIAPPWWQSAIALQATLDYMLATGSRDWVSQAHNTINIQRAPLSWWLQGNGDFRADSTDDTAWWALALTSMYTLTGEERLLEIAKEDEAYLYSYWSQAQCGGGLIWDIPSMTYKNAISNELVSSFELSPTTRGIFLADISPTTEPSLDGFRNP
jgi:hypothetical protein